VSIIKLLLRLAPTARRAALRYAIWDRWQRRNVNVERKYENISMKYQ
jgi:hypothetical protein